MKCKEWDLFQTGALSETAWRAHAASCAQCQREMARHETIAAALVPPAAPAELVEKVFAKTTRRKSWLVRWRAALAGGVVAVAVAVGVVYNLSHPEVFTPAELVSYMDATQTSEYNVFLSDLNSFEQEF